MTITTTILTYQSITYSKMPTEESSSCPICLESLFAAASLSTSATTTTSSNNNNDDDDGLSSAAHGGGGGGGGTTTGAIGSAIPCGHCLHVHCWDEWMAVSMNKNIHSGSSSNVTMTTTSNANNITNNNYPWKLICIGDNDAYLIDNAIRQCYMVQGYTK